RNIITGDLAAYVSSLKPGATMLLSGFYEADIPVIMEVAAPLGLTEVSHSVLNDWTCLKLKFN
ncbi:MAG: 50S ribosomal protein L11 methyltransferase, partial [Muribaculaceae bacterium]|nr:50S ribosomal protein L11 methyltransferase [Muribaculaceae bacterium]